MHRRIAGGAMLAAAVVAAVDCRRHEAPTCQSDIVSSSAVSSYCGHREGENQVLDLVILWRGTPGWFQRRGSRGGGGSAVSGGMTNGRVSQYRTYGDVTIAFDADFDANVVVIGQSTIQLNGVNAILVDHVDADWLVAATPWIDPHLPLSGDWNLALARRSADFRRALLCEVPMPAAPAAYRAVQPTVVTVCEKLRER
jgi:hypothetical protein